jgi:hypothetical protein
MLAGCRGSSFGRLGALLATNWGAMYEIQQGNPQPEGAPEPVPPECKTTGLMELADSWIGVR